MMNHAKFAYNGWSLSTVNLPIFHCLVGLSPRLDGGGGALCVENEKEFTIRQKNSYIFHFVRLR